MPMDPDDVKRVFARYQELLAEHQRTLNGLNVYPVPDGDTGSNLLATVRVVNERLGGARSMEEVADVVADGSLRGATGNSGLILSLILRGLAAPIRGAAIVGPVELSSGLAEGAARAYAQVGTPREGTMLTVIREAAEAAAEASIAGKGWLEMLRAVYERSVESLDRTPTLLPELRRAGVVDAGGAGVVLLLAAILGDQAGVVVSLPDHVLAMTADLTALQAGRHDAVADLRYEVMFFLEAEDEAVEGLREIWDRLGDSIVVVGGEGVWNCHIHTDHVGPAIEAGVTVGRPREIKVTDLLEQAGEHAMHAEDPGRSGRVEDFRPRFEAALAPVGVVAVAVGKGIVEVFRDLGAQGVVIGGQSMNPSVEDLLAAVEDVPADRVVVLPNNRNIVPVAEELDSLTTKKVMTVPTRSIPQGIAAMMGYTTGEEDVELVAETMSAAASSVVDAEVTQAVRDARVPFGAIAKGDWMGIADGTVVVADPDLETTLRQLVAGIWLDGSELVTIYTGQGALPAATKALEAWIGDVYTGTEVTVIEGGQPLYPYLLSIE